MAPALLFDIDGTLMDTDPLHLAVFRELFAAHGRDIDEGFYARHLHGRLNADIFAEFFPDGDAKRLSDEKEAAFRDRLGASSDPTIGLADLLERGRSQGWRMAVVSNAPRENAEAILSALGLLEAFDALALGEDCARGKPAPDPYLAAMRTLGVAPADCLAFEDSPSGIASAKAAGLYTIGLRSSLGDAALREAGADATIADFADTALPGYLARLTGACT